MAGSADVAMHGVAIDRNVQDHMNSRAGSRKTLWPRGNYPARRHHESQQGQEAKAAQDQQVHGHG